MHIILRALVVWVGIYVACVVAVAALWLWLRSGTRSLDQGAMLGATLALWFAVHFARASFKRLRERRRVVRAERGDPPRDGDAVAARGTLQCASPLVTPFSGAAAVAYTYRAWRNESRDGDDSSYETAYWWGEGSVPCTLLTRQGSLRLLTRPTIETGAHEVRNTDRAREAFTHYLEGRPTMVVTSGLMLAGFEWDAPLDGPLQRDKVRSEPPPELTALTFEEKVLSPGEPVVVMGRYSAAQGGLLHDEANGTPLRAFKGDSAKVSGRLRSGATIFGMLALVALAIAAVFAAQMLL